MYACDVYANIDVDIYRCRVVYTYIYVNIDIYISRERELYYICNLSEARRFSIAVVLGQNEEIAA